MKVRILSLGLWLLLSASTLPIPGRADEDNNSYILKTSSQSFSGKVTFSFGKELLYYTERERDKTQTESQALANNEMLYWQAVGDWQHTVLGVKGVTPTATKEVTETWDSLGFSNYQKNQFTYQWSRYDAYTGYSFYYPTQDLFYTAYLGLRLSRAKFVRREFRVLGVLQTTPDSTESVISQGLLFGLRGAGVIKEPLEEGEYRSKGDEIPPKWAWGWGIEGVVPLSNEVTNTLAPGVTFRNRSGYAMEGNGWLGWYLVPGKVSLDGTGYLGFLHWNGSNWKTLATGQIKWPTNDTIYGGITLGLHWRF